MSTSNKKRILVSATAGVIGVGASAGGIAAGIMASQSTDRQDGIVEEVVKNDSMANTVANSYIVLLIKEATTDSLKEVLTPDVISNIESEVLASNGFLNVDLEYIADSAQYNGASSTVKFNATPLAGHAWEDNTNGPITVTVTLLNVNVDNDEDGDTQKPPVILNDAVYASNVEFNDQIIIESESNESFEKAVFAISNEIIQDMLNDPNFKNVNIKYDRGSADLANKNAQFIATPNVGHAWEDGTTVSKKISVQFSNIALKATDLVPSIPVENKVVTLSGDFSYWMPVYGMFDSQQMAWDFISKREVPDIVRQINDQNPNTTVKYIVSHTFTSNTSMKIVFAIEPNEGYKWSDGTTGAKNITVTVGGFKVKYIYNINNASYAMKYFTPYDYAGNAYASITMKYGNTLRSNLAAANPELDILDLAGYKTVGNQAIDIFFNVAPKSGFSWGFNGEKVASVRVTNIKITAISNPKDGSYRLSTYGTFSSESMAWDFISRRSMSKIKNLVTDINPMVELVGIAGYKFTDASNLKIQFSVKPKDGYKWEDTFDSSEKIVSINVSNFSIK